jgi:hypothetical protein
MDRSISIRIDHDLRNSAAIAQIDKEEAAVIAAPVDPTHEHSFLSSVRRPQRSAHVGAS